VSQVIYCPFSNLTPGQAARHLRICERLRTIHPTSSPVLRPVPDVQDFDNLFGIAVHDNVRRADQFAGSLYLSWSANAGEHHQPFNAVDNRLGDLPGGAWIVLLDVFNSGFKLVGGFGCPPKLPHE